MISSIRSLVMLWIVLFLTLTGCIDRRSTYPLTDADDAFTSLAWGDSPETALKKMSALDSVRLTRSFVRSAGGEWVTGVKDSNVVIPIAGYLLRQEYDGGSFLGDPVTHWALDFDLEVGLVSVTVYPRRMKNYALGFDATIRFLARYYGQPYDRTLEEPRYDSTNGSWSHHLYADYYLDGWTEGADDTTAAATAFRLIARPSFYPTEGRGYLIYVYNQAEWRRTFMERTARGEWLLLSDAGHDAMRNEQNEMILRLTEELGLKTGGDE